MTAAPTKQYQVTFHAPDHVCLDTITIDARGHKSATIKATKAFKENRGIQKDAPGGFCYTSSLEIRQGRKPFAPASSNG